MERGHMEHRAYRATATGIDRGSRAARQLAGDADRLLPHDERHLATSGGVGGRRAVQHGNVE